MRFVDDDESEEVCREPVQSSLHCLHAGDSHGFKTSGLSALFPEHRQLHDCLELISRLIDKDVLVSQDEDSAACGVAVSVIGKLECDARQNDGLASPSWQNEQGPFRSLLEFCHDRTAGLRLVWSELVLHQKPNSESSDAEAFTVSESGS